MKGITPPPRLPSTIITRQAAVDACKVVAMSLGVRSAGPEVLRRFAAIGADTARAAGSAPAAVVISFISDVLSLVFPFDAIAINATHGGVVRAQDIEVRYAELLLLKPMVEKVREFNNLPPLGLYRTAPAPMYPFGHTVYQGPEITVGHFFREQILEAGPPESSAPDYVLQIAAFMAAADDDDRLLRDTYFNPGLHRFGGVRALAYETYMNTTCGTIRARCRDRGITLRRPLL